MRNWQRADPTSWFANKIFDTNDNVHVYIESIKKKRAKYYSIKCTCGECNFTLIKLKNKVKAVCNKCRKKILLKHSLWGQICVKLKQKD